MAERIPREGSDVEVRQAFQRLERKSRNIDISDDTNLAATSPIVLTGDTLSLDQTAIDHGTIGGLGDDDHGIYLLADGTRALGGNWSLGSNDLTSVGLFGGVDVPEMNGFFNGTFQEMFNATVTSDGATITLSLEKSGTGDLTMQFSDGYTTLDCTDPLQTIALTAGSADTSPQANYIYVPQSSKALTKSTSAWPAGEHIKVAYLLVPTAGFVQTNGCYVNQNWNDFLFGTTPQGHMSHISKKSRRLGANWFSGVNANGATASYFTIGVNTVDWLSTSGVVMQLHEHTFPAVETSGSDVVLVVNQNGAAYDDITDLYSITDDNTGTTITNNRYFNLTFWGVVNKSGEFSALMVNLPGGFYVKQSDALVDADGYDVNDIPREFSIDSGTGFLICRATFQMGGTWTHISTTDLRGLTPATASGSSVNDHGGLGGLTDDDHPQYFKIKVDSAATEDYLGAASSDGVLRTGTGLGYTDGGDYVTLALSHLGIESLADAGSDKILFWDDGAGATAWLAVTGTGVGISGTDLQINVGYVSRGNLSAPDYGSHGSAGSDPFAGNYDNAYHDLDLSSIIPAGAYAVEIGGTLITTNAGDRLSIQNADFADSYSLSFNPMPVANVNYGINAMVTVNSSREIKWKANANVDIKQFNIRGWYI